MSGSSDYAKLEGDKTRLRNRVWDMQEMLREFGEQFAVAAVEKREHQWLAMIRTRLDVVEGTFPAKESGLNSGDLMSAMLRDRAGS